MTEHDWTEEDVTRCTNIIRDLVIALEEAAKKAADPTFPKTAIPAMPDLASFIGWDPATCIVSVFDQPIHHATTRIVGLFHPSSDRTHPKKLLETIEGLEAAIPLFEEAARARQNEAAKILREQAPAIKTLRARMVAKELKKKPGEA